MLKQVKYLIIACHDEMKVQLLNAPIYGERSSSKEIV